jgi:hypothetical protein
MEQNFKLQSIMSFTYINRNLRPAWSFCHTRDTIVLDMLHTFHFFSHVFIDLSNKCISSLV